MNKNKMHIYNNCNLNKNTKEVMYSFLYKKKEKKGFLKLFFSMPVLYYYVLLLYNMLIGFVYLLGNVIVNSTLVKQRNKNYIYTVVQINVRFVITLRSQVSECLYMSYFLSESHQKCT